MRKRRLLNEVHCGIDMDQFWYQQDHNAPNSKLYARAPVFAKRSMVWDKFYKRIKHTNLLSTDIFANGQNRFQLKFHTVYIAATGTILKSCSAKIFAKQNYLLNSFMKFGSGGNMHHLCICIPFASSHKSTLNILKPSQVIIWRQECHLRLTWRMTNSHL